MTVMLPVVPLTGVACSVAVIVVVWALTERDARRRPSPLAKVTEGG